MMFWVKQLKKFVYLSNLGSVIWMKIFCFVYILKHMDILYLKGRQILTYGSIKAGIILGC
jgi:hypothetical protein